MGVNASGRAVDDMNAMVHWLLSFDLDLATRPRGLSDGNSAGPRMDIQIGMMLLNISAAEGEHEVTVWLLRP
jgi:hypothetical protein